MRTKNGKEVKAMKKLLFAISAFALLMGAASCQDELGGKIDSSVENPLNTITVKMGNSTRLGIDENKTPFFDEGDEVFGWDADGNYTYQCTSVSGSEATFTRTSDYAPSADEGTKVNLVFANGFSAEDITDGTLAIDISEQNAASFEELPVVMTASGAVDADGKCSMAFANETSVIKVTDCITSEAEGVEFESIEASNLFPQMTISIDADGNMVKTPGTTPGTITNKGGFTAGADGKISTCIATFPTQGSATEISFRAKTGEDYNDRYYKFEGGSKIIKSNVIVNMAGKTFSKCDIAMIRETSTTYASLADAIAAAGTTPATIVLLDDSFTSKIATAAGSDITLDLNGKTIASYLSVFGKLTINNGDNSTNEGTFNVSRTYNQAFYLRPGCELIINGGTINGAVDKTGEEVATIMAVGKDGETPVKYTINGGILNGYSAYGAIKSKYAEGVINDGIITCSNTDETVTCKALWTSTDSDVTINGGKFDSSMYAFYFGATSSKMTINDAVVSAKTGLFNLYSAGTVNIQSGYYSAPNLASGNKKTANFVTEGGYYTVEPNFVSTGYAAKSLSSPVTKDGVTYNYTIAEFDGKVEISGVAYEDMAEAVAALNAATSDVTAKFLQSINLTQEIVINNANAKVTLDLNGKTVRAQNASGKTALLVTGASTVVDIMDSVGGGSFDHSYSGTGYTVTLNGGTLNLISGSINNNTSTGYGRWALKVAAADAPATFNMSGGEIHGGRAISIGSGSEDKLAKVNISGGLVEGKNTTTSSGNYYTAIDFENTYGELVITGGTIVSKARAAIYSSKTNTSITIKEGNNGTVPCISGGYYVLTNTGSVKGCFKSPVKFYSNKTNGDGLYQTGLSTACVILEEPYVDAYGYEYKYLLQSK